LIYSRSLKRWCQVDSAPVRRTAGPGWWTSAGRSAGRSACPVSLWRRGAEPAGDENAKRSVEEEEEGDETEPLDLEAPPAPTGEPRATVVVIDHELSPRQLRNIQGATSAAEVLDRTGVIIEIFHRHASSRPARLQVEIARLTYVAPRLRETGGGARQRGGIGLKGAGESSVELDRRKIRDRISELKAELAAIEDESKTRRARRQEALRVALVGYTNAGKSSLMRALTGSHVLVADKLFATLDTTVHALWPESRPRILAIPSGIHHLPRVTRSNRRYAIRPASRSSRRLVVNHDHETG
jgi:GTP-binding protein HflX